MNRRAFLQTLALAPTAIAAVVKNPVSPKVLVHKPRSVGATCFVIESTPGDGPSHFYKAFIESQRDHVWQAMHVPAEFFPGE